jgi:hypothetical protein
MRAKLYVFRLHDFGSISRLRFQYGCFEGYSNLNQRYEWYVIPTTGVMKLIVRLVEDKYIQSAFDKCFIGK